MRSLGKIQCHYLICSLLKVQSNNVMCSLLKIQYSYPIRSLLRYSAPMLSVVVATGASSQHPSFLMMLHEGAAAVLIGLPADASIFRARVGALTCIVSQPE